MDENKQADAPSLGTIAGQVAHFMASSELRERVNLVLDGVPPEAIEETHRQTIFNGIEIGIWLATCALEQSNSPDELEAKLTALDAAFKRLAGREPSVAIPAVLDAVKPPQGAH